MENEQDTPKKNENSYSNYGIRIGKNLSERVDSHIELLKYLRNESLKKNQWLTDAISEKLEREENLQPHELPKDKHINIKMHKQLRARLDRIRLMLKSMRRAYSKKQWVEEAIGEKIAKEETEAKRQLALKNSNPISESAPLRSGQENLCDF